MTNECMADECSTAGAAAAARRFGATASTRFPILVMRHSGRGSGTWRVVTQRASIQAATATYTAHAKNLRQGGVAMFDLKADYVVKIHTAPRLRTQW